MGYKVVMTDEFGSALDMAVAHRMDTRGLRSARRLLDEVDRVSALLETMPRMGSLVDQETESPSPNALRWVRMDGYIAACRVYDERETVTLDKLFYATSNWRKRVR